MPTIPRDPLPESTIALRHDPYGYIAKRCRKYGSDVFEARLMLQRTLCMSGRDAAALFYDGDRFTRLRAAPEFLQKTLFGMGGVQVQDSLSHLDRKAMFMALMEPDRIADPTRLTEASWRLEILSGLRAPRSCFMRRRGPFWRARFANGWGRR